VTLITTGDLVAPLGGKGIWFYSAALAFLLGDLVVEPWYTKPADALVNTTAVFLAAVAASAEDFDAISPQTFAAGRIAVLVTSGILVAVVVTALLTKPPRGATAGHVHTLAFTVAGTLGSARVIFGGFFAISAAAAFSNDVVDLLVLYLFGFLVLQERVTERLLAPLLSRPRRREAPSAAAIVRVVEPFSAVVAFAAGSTPLIGSRASKDGETLGLLTFVSSAVGEGFGEIALHAGVRLDVADEIDFELPDAGAPAVLGSVTAGTQLERVLVRASPAQADALGVREGGLLTAQIRGEAALYQVVNAQIEHGSPEGPSESKKLVLTARKLGAWNESAAAFELVEWVPHPGSAVRAAQHAGQQGFDPRFVGVVPGTPYGIEFDPDEGIRHNTAVFGVLGSGKTTLAAELVWRTLKDGVKAVVVDITDQWAGHFTQLDAEERQTALEKRLNDAVETRAGSKDVDGEQAGNVAAFRRAVADELGTFLDGPEALMILNPTKLLVTQELGFLRYGAAEVLRSLTPAEVTACVSVALLERVSAQMRDRVHVVLVLEEAHTLAPEFNAVAHDKEKQATTATARAVLQGRKYGMGCLVITQRTANVTKTVLNQCNTVFALRVYDQTGAEFLGQFIGGDYAGLLPNLDDRHAVVFGRGSSSRGPVIVRVNDFADTRGWKQSIADSLRTSGNGNDD
jgi:hypothetical protein